MPTWAATRIDLVDRIFATDVVLEVTFEHEDDDEQYPQQAGLLVGR